MHSIDWITVVVSFVMPENSCRHATKQTRMPRLFREAKRIVQKVREEGGSMKGLVYDSKLLNEGRLKALYGLVSETLRHGSELSTIVRQSQILIKEPRLDAWLARVLITQLLWGKQPLVGSALPIKIILNYESELRGLQEKLSSVSQTVSSKRPKYVRINTLKASEQEVVDFFVQDGWKEVSTNDTKNYDEFLSKVASLSDGEFIRDMHIPNLLIFPENLKFYDLQYYQDNYFILQDKASCMSAFLLDPEPGSTVLDMCAAPGMKTTHAAAILNNMGTVYAIEKHPGRYGSLCKVVKQSAAACVKTILGNALDYNGSSLPDVEYILVDPSCSGSGMTNRQDIFNESSEISPERLEKLAAFQSHLLRHAMTNFPNAKRIVYSTCSTCPEENEAVIEATLNSTQNFKPILPPNGTEWMQKGSTSYTWGDFGFYARPEVNLTNGFFVAVFERTETEYIPGKNFVREEQRTNSQHSEDKISDKKKKQEKAKLKSDTKPIKNTVPSESLAQQRMMKAMGSINQSSEADVNSSELKKKRNSIKESSEEVQNDEEFVSIIADDCSSETKKKKKKKSKKEPSEEVQNDENPVTIISDDHSSEQKKKKKRKSKEDLMDEVQIDEERVSSISDGHSPQPKKKKKKKSKEELTEEVQNNEQAVSIIPDVHSSESKTKKKKKTKVPSVRILNDEEPVSKRRKSSRTI